MTQLDMGKDLRDAALDKSKQGREARIEAVRDYLLDCHDRDLFNDYPTLTGDTVCNAMEVLGMLTKENRWAANVLRGWDAVRPTNEYVPSTRPSSHARPLRVWRWV